MGGLSNISSMKDMMFDHISKHWEESLIYDAQWSIFDKLWDVLKMYMVKYGLDCLIYMYLLNEK